MPKTTAIPHREWTITESGDWGKDCAAGRRAADRVMRYVQETGYAPALGIVAKAIMERGRWGAVETGYFTRLASHLTA